MFQCPLPMLSISRDAPFTATIDLPDGTHLDGVPAASEAQAVHNLFEGWHGNRVVLPLGQHITPLAIKTIDLCRLFRRLIAVDVEFSILITQHDRQPLPKIETIGAVHQIIVQIQAVILAAKEAHTTLTAIAADKHAGAMGAHPVTAYAEMIADMAMGLCKQSLTQLGLPGAITGNYEVNFDLTFEERFDVSTPGWPTEQANRWWDDRKRRLKHYDNTLARIAQEGPHREQRIKEKTMLCGASCQSVK